MELILLEGPRLRVITTENTSPVILPKPLKKEKKKEMFKGKKMLKILQV